MRRFAFAAAALVFAGFAATPAFAHEAETVAGPRVTVAYHDLNLSTVAGADAMIQRLETAARRVCRTAGSGLRGLEQREERQACRAAALETAVASLEAPVVTARFEGSHSAPTVVASAW